jgi:hypothetical protein
VFDLSAKMAPVYVADVNAASSEVSETFAPLRRSYWDDVKIPIF